ncbi:MAG TPA: hypothetical protein VIF82_05250 [Burkholderiaceae bacterium]|jgi:hypothetical protein
MILYPLQTIILYSGFFLCLLLWKMEVFIKVMYISAKRECIAKFASWNLGVPKHHCILLGMNHKWRNAVKSKQHSHLLSSRHTSVAVHHEKNVVYRAKMAMAGLCINLKQLVFITASFFAARINASQQGIGIANTTKHVRTGDDI